MDLKTHGHFCLLPQILNLTHPVAFCANMRQAMLNSYEQKTKMTAELDVPTMVSSQSNKPKELSTQQNAFERAEGIK
jgi:ABC-type sulfate/molybdate transport systems ATPase subunit